MMLRFACQECGKKLKARADDAGRIAICRGCGARVTIPAAGGGQPADMPLATQDDEPLLVLPKRSQPDDLIDMTAMVDVVFFLLIFFLVTSIQAIQAVIDMPTPQAPVGAVGKGRTIADYEQDPDFVVVRIEDDDSIWVEDAQTFGDQDLCVRLRGAAQERKRAPSVLVVASADGSHGAAVRVFDACAFARVKDISFVVQESTGGG
jgi:biopolymer transport protein ExbD